MILVSITKTGMYFNPASVGGPLNELVYRQAVFPKNEDRGAFFFADKQGGAVYRSANNGGLRGAKGYSTRA